jgi:hypothetical protein
LISSCPGTVEALLLKYYEILNSKTRSNNKKKQESI